MRFFEEMREKFSTFVDIRPDKVNATHRLGQIMLK